MNIDIPESVCGHIREIFSEVNDNVSRNISINPNIPEESLDISFIESLSQKSHPTIVTPGWAIRLSAHFVGNIRYYRRYEVADIGVVIEYRNRSKPVGRKLVLLQSKRLYPKNFEVTELDDHDYELGLGLVTGENSKEVPVFSEIKYEFNQNSSYGALRANSKQCNVIQDHFAETNIPVYYMLYNPVVVPWYVSYPSSRDQICLPKRTLGTRVISASEVHSILLSKYSANTPLKLADLLGVEPAGSYGLSLEDFFDGSIRCQWGYPYSQEQDIPLRKLFSRKSGPIFCIVKIAIEGLSE